ncbi:MAG: hypothetical protein AAF497_06475 [Planctomycetota bacterium]
MTDTDQDNQRFVIHHLTGIQTPVWFGVWLGGACLAATVAVVGYTVHQYRSVPQFDLFPYAFVSVALVVLTAVCGTSLRCIVDPEKRTFTRETKFVGCTVCAWKFAVKEQDVLFLLQHKDDDDTTVHSLAIDSPTATEPCIVACFRGRDGDIDEVANKVAESLKLELIKAKDPNPPGLLDWI